MKEPEFFEQAGTFVVRLWSRSYREPPKHVTLSERQKNILALLKNGPLSSSDILSELKPAVTDRTLRRDLQFLKTNGYVDDEGKTWKSRWFIISDK